MKKLSQVWPRNAQSRNKKKIRSEGFITAQMSVSMVFCGPHLPLAFQFVCGPGGGAGSSREKRDVSRHAFKRPSKITLQRLGGMEPSRMEPNMAKFVAR